MKGGEKMLYRKIAKMCKAKDINIHQLEMSCGLGNGTISNWKGELPKTVRSLKKIADYFGVSVDYLLR